MVTHVCTGIIGISIPCRRRSSVAMYAVTGQTGVHSMLSVLQRAGVVSCQGVMRHATLIPRHPSDTLDRQGNEQQAQKKCP
jgi:hypothetical protein